MRLTMWQRLHAKADLCCWIAIILMLLSWNSIRY